MKTKLLIMPLVILFILAACETATIQTRTYKTLSISQTTYDTLLSAAGDLYKQGKIDEVQKEEIVQIGKIYKQFHNAAVGALLKFNESGKLEDQESYLYNLSMASNTLAQLITYVRPLIEGGSI